MPASAKPAWRRAREVQRPARPRSLHDEPSNETLPAIKTSGQVGGPSGRLEVATGARVAAENEIKVASGSRFRADSELLTLDPGLCRQLVSTPARRTVTAMA